MPTIKRPQTYAEIQVALQLAKRKADNTPAADRAFSDATLARLNLFLPTFLSEMQEMGSALTAQGGATTAVVAAQPKTKTIISHYYQVFNFGIERGIYQANDRGHYHLPLDSSDLPPLKTETEITLWGGRVISGDAARVAAGGAPMANPSAAEVAAQYAIFIAAQDAQSNKKTAYDNEQEDVAEISVEALDLVDDIWDECEFTYRKESAPSKRRKCREYGLVYVPRAGETPSPDDFSMMGVITDSVSGLPIGGAAVVVAAATEIIVLTDGNGKYFVPVLSAGTYDVVVHKGGYTNLEGTVTVTEGAITTQNFQLVPAAPASTGTVQGQVRLNGVGVASTVSVEGEAISIPTDSNGNFVLPGVPSGAQVIRATVISDPTKTGTQNADVPPSGTVTVNFNLV